MRAWRRGSRAKSPGPLRPPPPHCRDGRPRSRCKPTRSRLRGAPSRAASRSGSADKAACTMLESAEVGHTIAKAGFEFCLQETRSLERMLVDEGFVLLKFWIHLSHDALAARLRELKRAGKRTRCAFKLDCKLASMYQKLRRLWEEMLRETSTAEAPWTVVEGTDERYRHLTVGKVLLDALKDAGVSARAALRRPRAAGPAPAAVANVKLIRSLDLTQRLSADGYQTGLTPS